MPTVAIYTRLSKDPDGEQTSTARQERSCRAFAELKGWRVRRVFEDVDTSAYRRVPRPRFIELQAGIEAGDFDGVLTWKLDRLVRRPMDFEKFWATCERRRVFLASVTEPIDSTTEIGLAIVRVLVTFAGLESSTKSLRLKSKYRELAEQGLPGNFTRPFGHTIDCTEIVPDEAAAIRDAAERILNGESALSVSRDWAARGTKTTRGNLWDANALFKMLLRPRLVGDRAWNDKEIVATDCFPPILDRLTQTRLRRLHASRLRGPSPVRPDRLLTGLLVCGECGHTMTTGGAPDIRAYKCAHPPKGCNRVAVRMNLLDEWVTEQVFAHLRAHPPQAKRHCRLKTAEYTEFVERLELLHRDFHVTRGMSRQAYLRCRSDLEAQLGDLGAAANLPAVEGLHRGFDLRYTESAWPTFNTVQRRAIIASQVAHIVVDRSTGRRCWNPDRIHVTWRESRAYFTDTEGGINR